MESATQHSKPESKYILPCIGGSFVPVIATIICRPLDVNESLIGIIILMLLFFLIGFVSILRGATSKKRVFFLVLLYLPLGVIINIMVDSYVLGGDHNLFPFEFIIYPLLAFAPLLLGIYLGGLVNSNKSFKL